MISYNGTSEVDGLLVDSVDNNSIHQIQHVVQGQLSSMIRRCVTLKFWRHLRIRHRTFLRKVGD